LLDNDDIDEKDQIKALLDLSKQLFYHGNQLNRTAVKLLNSAASNSLENKQFTEELLLRAQRESMIQSDIVE